MVVALAVSHAVTESDEIDHEATMQAALDASPGVVAISATIRYEDGRFERITVRRPGGPTPARVQ